MNHNTVMTSIIFDASMVHHIEYPGCGKVYVGKTNCCLGKRLDEHGTREDQPMHIHLNNCEEFKYMVNLLNLPDIDTMSRNDVKCHILNAVRENSKALMSSDDWLTLAYMEPLLAKKHNATINHGAKVPWLKSTPCFYLIQPRAKHAQKRRKTKTRANARVLRVFYANSIQNRRKTRAK